MVNNGEEKSTTRTDEEELGEEQSADKGGGVGDGVWKWRGSAAVGSSKGRKVLGGGESTLTS